MTKKTELNESIDAQASTGNRTSRSAETRAKDTARKPWRRPQMLDTPEPPEGYEYRWIRAEIVGQEDRKNVTNIIGDSSPVITTLARVEERKGHKYILNALSEIKNKFPKILYLIAGKGPYLEEIKKYTSKLRLDDNVKFLGWITEPEKSLILKNSDLFVMTPTEVGESVEGFGMAYIDASFHGVASVGSNSGGIADAIVNNETGIVCDSGDQKMITEKILLLLENEQLRNQLGKNGKKRATENYSWIKKVEEYLLAAN